MSDISVVILTRDEERHIERCISSVRPIANKVFVVDSYSTDRTVELAKSVGAYVVQHSWVNYATQFNWALDTLPITSKWVMRLDADEYLTAELVQDIERRIDRLPDDVTGGYVARRIYFLGTWVRHGGCYPIRHLRLWRRGCGRCEERWMDEHILLNRGKAISFQGDIVDENLNDLTWWISKHNSYATREAVDLLNLRFKFLPPGNGATAPWHIQDRRKRWMKEKIYSKLPKGFRAFAYFLLRYFGQGGFLDGRKGTIFHVLQGFWYRFLVDAKVDEIEARIRDKPNDVKAVLREYGIPID